MFVLKKYLIVDWRRSTILKRIIFWLDMNAVSDFWSRTVREYNIFSFTSTISSCPLETMRVWNTVLSINRQVWSDIWREGKLSTLKSRFFFWYGSYCFHLICISLDNICATLSEISLEASEDLFCCILLLSILFFSAVKQACPSLCVCRWFQIHVCTK